MRRDMSEEKQDYQHLEERIDANEERLDRHDDRLDNLEATVADMRRETREGLNAVNANIETLSQQMTNMDSRLVEEKIKWGDVFRSVVKWTIRTGLAIIAYAAGLNITRTIFGLGG